MPVAASLYLRLEAQRLIPQPALDDFLETNESSATNEKNIRSIDREKFLMRMFSTPLRRNVCDCPFQDLQQCLLNAFTGNVAGNRRVFIFPANLVNLVDVDNALL